MLWRRRKRPEFFDAAQANPVGFAEGSIHGARLGNAHLGATDQGRHVGRVGVAVADKAFRMRALVNCRFENPAFDRYITKVLFDSCSDPGAAVAPSHAEQTRVCDVPSPVEKLEMAGRHGQAIHVSQLS
jgi:hypothetical protein